RERKSKKGCEDSHRRGQRTQRATRRNVSSLSKIFTRPSEQYTAPTMSKHKRPYDRTVHRLRIEADHQIRVRWPDGVLSDMTSLTRAKDAVACFVETEERRQRGRHSPSEGRLCVKTDSWGKGPAAG